MKKKLFLVLLAAAAGLFAACKVDDAGSVEAEILDSGARYGISVTVEKEDSGGLVAVANTGGLVTVSPAGRVKAGTKVTLTVNTALIPSDDTPDTEIATSTAGTESGGGGGIPMLLTSGLSRL